MRNKENHRTHDIARLDRVRAHPDVVEFLRKGDEYLGALGYTEHGTRHASLVAHIAYNVLERLSYPVEVADALLRLTAEVDEPVVEFVGLLCSVTLTTTVSIRVDPTAGA